MGRGRRRGNQGAVAARERELPLSDHRSRLVPGSLQDALKRPLDSFDFGLLGALAYKLVDGYTDDDVSELSKLIESALGLPFVVAWDYREDGSCAGAAEEYLVKDGLLYELPSVLYALLLEGSLPDADELANELATLRPAVLNLEPLVFVSPGNFVVQDRDA